jgi:hypothetical protein
MKLKTYGVGGKRTACQPRPLDRALAFLDPLLARPALVVEGDDSLGRSRQIGDDEADARIKLARVPLDLYHHTARCLPTLRLIAEAGVVPSNLARRASRARRDGDRHVQPRRGGDRTMDRGAVEREEAASAANAFRKNLSSILLPGETMERRFPSGRPGRMSRPSAADRTMRMSRSCHQRF